MFSYALDEDLTLELQSYDQASEYYHLIERNREHLGRWFDWVQHVHSVGEMRFLLDRDLQGMAMGRRFAWLIRYRGQVAGRIGVHLINVQHREATLAYWLGEAYTKRGIITRSARTILDWCFTELKLHRVRIECEAPNRASIAVAQRLGFTHELTLREDVLHRDGQRHDLWVYGLRSEEWDVQQHPHFALSLGDGATLQLQQMHHVDDKYRLVTRNRAELHRWLSWADDSYTRTIEQQYIQYGLEQYAQGTLWMLGIWQGNVLAGHLSLSLDRENHHGQLGYYLDAQYRGRGLMTRAIAAVLRWGFIKIPLHRVWLRIAQDNLPSIQVAQRLGMTQEAILRDENYIAGRWVTHMVYSTLADEWKANTA